MKKLFLIFVLIAGSCMQAAEVRFLSWGEPLENICISNSDTKSISLSGDRLTSPVFISKDLAELELYRLVKDSEGKPVRQILARTILPMEDRLLAIVVKNPSADTPFSILTYPDQVSDAERKSLSVFNFSLVPLAVQIGEPGATPAHPTWSEAPRMIRQREAGQWQVAQASKRVPMRLAAQRPQVGWQQLFARNLQSYPGFRTLVFILEDHKANERPVPGEDIVYRIIQDPLPTAPTAGQSQT